MYIANESLFNPHLTNVPGALGSTRRESKSVPWLEAIKSELKMLKSD